MNDVPWLFRLYVVGSTPMGQRALANLRLLVDRHLPNRAEIEVVDLATRPEESVSQRILAIPTVVRVRPDPEARMIGDLSDADEARDVLNLPPPAA